jgi:DNA modification methylase
MTDSLLIQGNTLDVLRTRPDASVQCVVTSPPYWGLRDYGLLSTIWDGDTTCVHEWGDEGRISNKPKRDHDGRNAFSDSRGNEQARSATTLNASTGAFCQHCGAWRGQLGLEPTPWLFIDHLILIFHEVWRVLRKDGTLWLNMGDCHASGGRGGGGSYMNERGEKAWGPRAGLHGWRSAPEGFKHKDLMGMPWRLAFALQDDGWYLRQEVIWAKPNPMPESCKDRPTTAHERLFLLTRSPRYYYDAEAIKEPVTGKAHTRGNGINPKACRPVSGWDTGSGSHSTIAHNRERKQNASFSGAIAGVVTMRNKRSVWEIPTQAFPEAHFATFPEKLVEPCILAGSRPDDTVLDPFCGSGTVGAVSRRLGRAFVGIDLNAEYLDMARRRIDAETPPLPFEEDHHA